MRDRSGVVLSMALALAMAMALVVVDVPSADRSASAADPELPPGFSRTAIATGLGPYQLTNFVVLPDGAFLVTGKSGEVRHVTPLGNHAVGDVDVDDRGDLGLIGIALANDYAETGRLYLAYNYVDADERPLARVASWRVDDPDDPRDMTLDTVILDGISADDYPSHSLNTVLVDPTDDTLWVSVGDGYRPDFPEPDSGSLRAQHLDNPFGKILHLLPNGDGAPDNPYYEPARPGSWKSRTYAYGFRNPFRFTRRDDGRLFVADVGWYVREELSLVQRGGNHGWPCYEGDMRAVIYGDRDDPECRALYEDEVRGVYHARPMWHYDHGSGLGQSVTGGAFVSNATYPPEYQGAYFFGDYVSQRVWTARINDAGTGFSRPPEPGAPVSSTASFGTSMGGVVAFHPGPQGDLHIADINTSTLWRLRYLPGNRAPTAKGSADYEVGELDVAFSAAESSDPDGDAITYDWDFGDGSTSTEAEPQHTYATLETRWATLTVTDEHGATAQDRILVALDNHPPVLELGTPPEGTRYAVGDTVALEARASDAEDGPIDPDDIRWSTMLHHCPTPSACHVHPGPTGRGATFAVEFTDHGGATTFEIEARVEDGIGQTTTAVYLAEPELRTLSVSSEPEGVPLSINGISSTSRPAVAVAVGSRNTVSAPERYDDLAFEAWSNGLPSEHVVTMPDADLHLTATFGDAPDDEDDPEAQPVSRLSGPTRIHTAVAVSRSMFERSSRVVLARADDYADALSGGPLASQLGGPILLTGRDALHPATAQEIIRLGAQEVVVLGGSAAVSPAVEDDLRDVGQSTITRIAGRTRFETAALIAERFDGAEAVLVEGASSAAERGWPDAVAASALAAQRGQPILLTLRDVLPEPTRTALTGRSSVTIVGGLAAVDEAVARDVEALGGDIVRLAGRNRFETSVRVVTAMRDEGADPSRLWLATGRDWPDVLTAAPAAVADGAALLLIDGLGLEGSPAARSFLDEVAADLAAVRVVGGPGVVTDQVLEHLREQVSVGEDVPSSDPAQEGR